MLSPTGRIDTGTAGQWAFVFADTSGKENRQLVGLFQNDKMPDASLQLQVGKKADCNLLDVYGNAEPITVAADGSITVPIRHRPAYLVIVGGQPIDVGGVK